MIANMMTSITITISVSCHDNTSIMTKVPIIVMSEANSWGTALDRQSRSVSTSFRYRDMISPVA